MIIGLGTYQLYLSESFSLKDKRRVIKSLLMRLHNKFNVSAAEIDDHENWQRAIIAIAYITNDAKHASQVINKIAEFIMQEGRLELINWQSEII